MWGGRVLMLLVVAASMSGCAGARARQELARLQSQVGLLDERVTQLEHAGGTPGASLNEPAPEAGTTVASTTASQPKVTVGKKASVKSPGKPHAREIQQALKNAGFYQGAVDGKLGPQTRDAVKEFQRVHGLRDDGVVGRQTWSKLRAYADLAAGGNTAEPLK